MRESAENPMTLDIDYIGGKKKEKEKETEIKKKR